MTNTPHGGSLTPFASSGAATNALAGISPRSRLGKDVVRIGQAAQLDTLRTAALAHVEQARMSAIDRVTEQAMHSVAMVSHLEQHLAQSVPYATERLQTIANMHTMAMAQEMGSFSRRLPS